MDTVTEDECSICSGWPAAERADTSQARTTFVWPWRAFCQMEFWQSIMVVTSSREELEALQAAIRQERRKGSLRPAHELLREIRSKVGKH